MQSIIIFFLIAILFSVILSNFLKCAAIHKGNDFTFIEFKNRFSIKNIDISFIFIFFIIFEIISKFVGIKELIIFIPSIFALLLAFCMDIKYMIIPHTSCFVILFMGIIKNVLLFSKEDIISSILGLIAGGMFFYLVNLIFGLFSKKTGFGMGDIKLLASIGFLIGFKAIIVVIIMSIFMSAIFSLLFLLYNFITKKKEEYLPFGPFIVLSTLIVIMIPASQIIDMYFNIIDKLIIHLN